MVGECTNDGCVQVATVAVEFEDPSEVLGYCEPCGIYEFRNSSTATAVFDGPPEGWSGP